MKIEHGNTFDAHFHRNSQTTVFHGDRLDLLTQIPNGAARLVVTSPPYNIGKKYEKRLEFEHYLAQQEQTLRESVRILADDGSLCWQVGNHVATDGEIFPLDIFIYRTCKSLGLKLRNRIVWTFDHGLHCKNRFSGRYETIVWFTKSDDYIFNLDPVRVPQKYPGKKHFKGPKAGQYSCNPLGKNPSNVLDHSKCEAQPRREDRAPVPVSHRADRAPDSSPHETRRPRGRSVSRSREHGLRRSASQTQSSGR